MWAWTGVVLRGVQEIVSWLGCSGLCLPAGLQASWWGAVGAWGCGWQSGMINPAGAQAGPSEPFPDGLLSPASWGLDCFLGMECDPPWPTTCCCPVQGTGPWGEWPSLGPVRGGTAGGPFSACQPVPCPSGPPSLSVAALGLACPGPHVPGSVTVPSFHPLDGEQLRLGPESRGGGGASAPPCCGLSAQDQGRGGGREAGLGPWVQVSWALW